MKQIMHKILPSYGRVVLKQLRNFSILARDYGQFQSMRRWSAIDSKGNPIPWYTYPAIEYLSHLDLSDVSVLEYGSGNSTLWWAHRAAHVLSVEHDTQWHEKVKKSLGSLGNVEYTLKTDKNDYIQQSYLPQVDIVVIDGIHRSACADWIILTDISHITMLIFDNADWYPKTIKRLNESLGWVQADFHGFGPINGYAWTTSIFINPAHTRKIKYAGALTPLSGLPDCAADDSPENA